MAQAQALSHDLPSQIEVPVFEAQLLADGLIELERQGLGAVQQHQFPRQDLHSSRRKVCVGGAGRTLADAPFYADHKFAAQTLCFLEDLSRVRVEHDLQQPLAVAQIDKNDATVIPAAVYPTRDRDFLASELLVDVSAVM